MSTDRIHRTSWHRRTVADVIFMIVLGVGLLLCACGTKASSSSEANDDPVTTMSPCEAYARSLETCIPTLSPRTQQAIQSATRIQREVWQKEAAEGSSVDAEQRCATANANFRLAHPTCFAAAEPNAKSE
jgi:hypothetical protein